MDTKNPSFEKFLDSCSLKKIWKERLLKIVDSTKNPEDAAYSSRLVVIYGFPGVGKTFLAEKMIQELKLPVLFLGTHKLQGDNITSVDSFKDLASKLEETKKCVVFIDDFDNIMRQSDGGAMHPDDKKYLFKIISQIKLDEEKLFFMTMQDVRDLEDSWLDRLDITLNMVLPGDESKSHYLTNKYHKLLNKNLVKELVKRSYGYDYRDLDSVIKIIYQKDKNINILRVKEALREYTPGYLTPYKIYSHIDITFNDIIGHEKIKNELLLLKQYLKKRDFFNKSGIKRNNVILFSGKHGIGKTMLVQALASELDLPLIEIEPRKLGGDNPIAMIHKMGLLIKKFRNYVVVVDEADKVLGKTSMFEGDTLTTSAVATMLDGIQSNSEAIVIFIANDHQRLGDAIRDRVQHFEFELPSNEDRNNFLKNKTSKIGIKIEEDLQTRFVNRTEEFNFRKMENVWNKFMFKLAEEKDVKIKRDKIYANPETIRETMVKTLDTIATKRDITGIG